MLTNGSHTLFNFFSCKHIFIICDGFSSVWVHVASYSLECCWIASGSNLTVYRVILLYLNCLLRDYILWTVVVALNVAELLRGAHGLDLRTPCRMLITSSYQKNTRSMELKTSSDDVSCCITAFVLSFQHQCKTQHHFNLHEWPRRDGQLLPLHATYALTKFSEMAVLNSTRSYGFIVSQ